jgi:hypothetical protein
LNGLLDGSSTGRPDWANFRIWGDCVLFAFKKITELDKTLGILFSKVKFVKNWIGLHFGRFFSQTHLVALLISIKNQVIVNNM